MANIYTRKEQIWNETNAGNVDELIGLGGRYGCIAHNFLSKAGLLESDHFPPRSAYSNAMHDHIKELDAGNMAAVTMTKAFHRQFGTTYNNTVSQTIMRRYFEAGNYFEAIDTNIGWYLSNPPRGTPIENVPLSTGQGDDGRLNLAGVDIQTAIRMLSRQAGMIKWLHEGIIAGLEIHVINGLISHEQKALLQSKHHLRDIGFLRGESPRRDAARQFIFQDVQEYRHRRGE